MALARRPGEPCAVGYDRAMTSGGGRGRQSSGKPLQQLLNAIVPGIEVGEYISRITGAIDKQMNSKVSSSKERYVGYHAWLRQCIDT